MALEHMQPPEHVSGAAYIMVAGPIGVQYNKIQHHAYEASFANEVNFPYGKFLGGEPDSVQD